MPPEVSGGRPQSAAGSSAQFPATVALIVAAGRGERLGAEVPKALVPVLGRTMLERSVDALRAVERVQRIVIALPPDRLDAAPEGTIAVAGGTTRSESVLAALAAAGPEGDVSATEATAGTENPDVATWSKDPGGAAGSKSLEGAGLTTESFGAVLVHDAARIFATAELFNAALDELERSGADAVVAAAPVTDTIKQVAADGRTVSSTLDRSRLWAVQTPQVFRPQALRQALHSDPQLLARATDDAWLIEHAGGSVVVLPAPADNFKITTPLDLRLAELILADSESQ